MRVLRAAALFGVLAGIAAGLSPAIAQADPDPNEFVFSYGNGDVAPGVDGALAVAAPSPNSPGLIIGTDDRIPLNGTRTFPFRATTLITFDTGSGGARCTGFLVSADTVATAGHCVAPGGTGAFYPVSSFRVSPGAEGASHPYGTCRARAIGTASAWLATAPTTSDYGAIKLDCTVGNNTGWFGLSSAETATGARVFTDGYPGDKPETHWFSQGNVTASSPSLLFYDNDTVGGQSGSPVWNGSRCGVCAVAIHTTGSPSPPFNHGTRIAGSALAFLRSAIAL